MQAQTLIRYLLGYLLGLGIFVAGIPYGLYAVALAFPAPGILPEPLRLPVALPLGLVGLAFVLWSHAALFFQGQGGPTDLFDVAVSPRTKHLVVTGPYRFTRNPMVFGANSCYAALAIYWNSLAALGLLAVFWAGVIYYLKTTEEKRLLADFGQEYEAYRQRVPMILPWPPKRKGRD